MSVMVQVRRRSRRSLGAALAALAVVVSAGVALGPTATAQDGSVALTELTGAELRWGLNNESNNAAHWPGTYNFFSAGIAPDPGKGGQKLPAEDWRANSGAVSIEKRQPGGSYAAATWTGLESDVDGRRITTAQEGRYSGHQAVFRGGTGLLDSASDSGQISWDGDVTVLFYSGLSRFTISDPKVTVVDGSGVLQAKIGGFASDFNDQARWEAMPEHWLTLAEFEVSDLSEIGSFTVDPAYLGRTLESADVGGEMQVRSGSHWGAFPRNFVRFQTALGTGAFWYSSGLTTDPAKVAAPLTVSYVLGGATTGAPISIPSEIIPGNQVPVDPGKPVVPVEPVDPLETDPGSGGKATGRVDVTNGVFRWGLTNEVNNLSHRPGAFNYLVAGKVANPGKGGTELTERGWRQSAGSVGIEKYLVGRGYQAATWDGLKTDSRGARISSANSKAYSNHQVVLSGGEGTVRPQAGSADIRWSGSFTVVLYNGLSFFYVSDPELKVRNNRGTVTAVVSGYGSDQQDQAKWITLPAQRVVLAQLGRVDLGKVGFTTTPTYLRHTVRTAAGQAPQVRTGASWGAFPQQFVDFASTAGVGPFWYSTGLITDTAKVALPITVSYNAARQVTPPVAPASVAEPASLAPIRQLLPQAVPAATQPVAGGIELGPFNPAMRLVAATPSSGTTTSVPDWTLWSGGVGLLVAAFCALLAARPARFNS